MEKIVVDYVYRNFYNARSKAREDVNHIAQNHGFKPLLINTRTTTEYAENHPSFISRLGYNFRKFFILLRSIWSIKCGSLVLFQFPFFPFGDFFSLLFCRCLKIKKCHLVILVHDILHFRITGVFDKFEIKTLQTASELIVHTPQMQDLFKKNGIDYPCRTLWLFDYLTEEVPCENSNHYDYDSVAFAGALSKSVFLKKLEGVTFNDIQMHLYGSKIEDTKDYPDWMKYMGRFSPENVTMLTEGWGLTWDGDEMDYLHSPLGNYLRYISSHKTSLYIAAGIPVIVSKESALAEYVEKNKLGIAISSLLELEKRITEFDKEEYRQIRKHVMEMSATLRAGGHLGAILDDIVRENCLNS